MLNRAKTLKDYRLHSRDGEVGAVQEFYFDDHYWTIRYLVADTGNWLTGRQVLISPYALAAVNKEEQCIAVDLTKKQIEDSPSLDSDKPVSRQFEETYYGFYGWPTYWGGSYMWGGYPYYPYMVRDREMWGESTQGEKTWDSRLRSTHDVSGHRGIMKPACIGITIAEDTGKTKRSPLAKPRATMMRRISPAKVPTLNIKRRIL